MSKTHATAILLTLLCAAAPTFAQDYKPGPDSEYQPGVPKGTLTKHTFNTSKIFPGTTRDYWIYVPAQYKKDEPACVMVFQDGGGFASDKGAFRVPVVFDNLIHKKEMPVTIAIMVNPGVIPAPSKPGQNAGSDSAAPDAAKSLTPLPRYNRSYEYDSPTDLYARFLIEELLPEVAQSYNLTTNPTGRAICGSSSGGIAAFVAAWERPDYFTRVVSFIGSFTNLRGGHDLPSLIRKTEPKPLRVFLQDGKADQDIFSGSWFIGNQDVDAALSFVGYEHQFVVGTEAHNSRHGGAIFPDALRYIWKDYPALPKLGTFAGKDKRNALDILIPGEDWQIVSKDHKGTEGPTADAAGNVYFSEGGASKIHKITPDGQVSLLVDAEGGADGMMVGPGNKLYVNANKSKELVTYDLADPKKRTVIASGFPSNNDLVVTHTGAVYVTDHLQKQVWFIPPGGEKKVVDTGLQFPNGIILTPDQSQLIVADMNGAGLYIYTIKDDGTLTNKALYYYAQIPPNRSTSGADGVAIDTRGNLFSTSHLGIQVFDQAGRVTAILPSPIPNKRPSNVDFGGPDHAYLYITVDNKVLRRKTKSQGTLFFNGPILPPAPRL